MVKIIVCDIDGTLVNEARELTSRTKNMIEKVHEKGILFGLASGRPVDELQRFTNIWGLDFPFDFLIGMNGSELWDESSQKEYSFYKLKKEWIKEITDFMAPLKLNPFIYKDHYVLATKLDDKMIASLKRNGKRVVITEEINDLSEEDNAKILYRMPESMMKEAERWAHDHIKDDERYKVFKTQPTMLEFAHVKTEKSNALIKYCELHDIDLKDVMAFGDATNDDGLIRYSGIGICMKNGLDTTKALADIILDKTNDEDGVADYIENNIL